MRKTKPIQQNETRKILWYFQIQTDHLIPVRRPEQVIVKKEKNVRKMEKEPAV